MKKVAVLVWCVLSAASLNIMADDIVWANGPAPVVDWLGNNVNDSNAWIVRVYESTNSTINFASLLPAEDDTWTGIQFNWGGVGVDGYATSVIANGNTTYGLINNDKTYSVIFDSSSFATATRWAIIDDAVATVLYDGSGTGFEYNAGGTVAGDWQAVPEPATALLFGIGGLGAWIIRRKKVIG